MDQQEWSRRQAMQTLGIPVALAGVTGGSSYGFARPGSDRSVAEQLPAMISVAEMGAVGDGRTDDTGAFQETVDRLAAAGGGTMVIPPGVFLTRTIHFPYEPATIHTVGAGTGRTTWRMAAPEQPIIAIDPREPPKRSMGARFEGFTVEAHPDGRADDATQIAIDCVGFSDVLFENLCFRSNGLGSVGSWFHTASHPHLTYHQRFRKLVCQKNVGPGRIIRTTNVGNELTNTNLLLIEEFWIYANSDMEVAFDLSRSTSSIIRQGLIESSGQDGIRLGCGAVVEALWIEDLKGKPIVFAADHAGTSSRNIVKNVYLSGFGGEIVVPRDCASNIFVNVAGGNFTIRRDDPLAGNIVVNSGGPRQQPRIVQFSGHPGRLLEVQAYRASGLGERWNLLYEFAPGAAGTIGLRILPATSSHLVAANGSAVAKANGRPLEYGSGWPISDFFVTAPNTEPVSIVVQLSLE